MALLSLSLALTLAASACDEGSDLAPTIASTLGGPPVSVAPSAAPPVSSTTTIDEPTTTASPTTTSTVVAPRVTTVATTPPPTTQPPPTTPPPTPTTTTLVPPDGLTAADRTLTEIATITGGLAPKSVVSSQTGLFFAQNMMYRHTVTVYDRDFELVTRIRDSVALSDFGYDEFAGEYQGSPVEAAFTSDGAYAYVSNYKMYGGGLSTAAGDECNKGSWPDSFVYRIDTSTLEIDQVIRVGPVPKFLAVTPDDRHVVVANWCGFDVSIVDVASAGEVARIPVGRHPRGVVISADSRTAYVAVMGSRRIAVIDLGTLEVSTIPGVGSSPRHLALSPDGGYLYVSLNGEGRIAKVDLRTGEVVGKVRTGSAPRSMAISDDGTALYVVNYESATMSKVRTADMVEIEEHRTRSNPIGITYDIATRQVWVSSYSGAIEIFVDAPVG